MIDQTLKQIEERLQQASAVPEQKREELRELFATLRAEIAEMAATDQARARDIAGHSERSTAEATRPQPDSDNLQQSIKGLSESVAGFEESHPNLVQVVNRICVTLSNLGI